MARVWRWLAIAAAVVGAILAAFFAGGSRKRGDQAAAVDAAHADDAVKTADKQILTLTNQAASLAAHAQKQTAEIEQQRQALPGASTDEIDRILIADGALKP